LFYRGVKTRTTYKTARIENFLSDVAAEVQNVLLIDELTLCSMCFLLLNKILTTWASKEKHNRPQQQRELHLSHLAQPTRLHMKNITNFKETNITYKCTANYFVAYAI
jgi:hypothetical protein